MGISATNMEFLSMLPQLATSIDTNVACRLSQPNNIDISLISATGLWVRVMHFRSAPISALGGPNDVLPTALLWVDPTNFCLGGDPINLTTDDSGVSIYIVPSSGNSPSDPLYI